MLACQGHSFLSPTAPPGKPLAKSEGVLSWRARGATAQDPAQQVGPPARLWAWSVLGRETTQKSCSWGSQGSWKKTLEDK